MRKYLFVFLICVPTYAGYAGAILKPYEIVHDIVQKADDSDIVAYGTHNDVLMQTNKNLSQLRLIYAWSHDSDFWSRYTVKQMVGENGKLGDNCFINFQYDSDTEYRLFCGELSDFKTKYRTVRVRKPITATRTDAE